MSQKVLMLASVASMIDQFNMPNIRLLQKLGYEVHVMCNFDEGNTCDARRLKKLQKMLSDMQVMRHFWCCPRNVMSVRKCWKAFDQLWKLTGQYQFQWIHCQSPVGGALARLAAHYRNIRVIYTAHGFHFYKGAPVRNWLLYYPAEKLFSYWTDVLITVNQEDYCFARRNLKARQIFRIPGVGISTARYSEYHPMCSRKEFCEKYAIPEDAVLLLSVGELSRRKNHQIVLDAIGKLHQKNLYYMICGQGALRKSLICKAEQLGVGAYLRMAGFVEDLREIYYYADIFVFPSVQEGLPVALVEAMASGLPCIASDIRGNRELMGAMEEQRFSLDCEQQLFLKLKKMLHDKKLREESGAYNRQRSKKYSITAVNHMMNQIYVNMSKMGNREGI